MSGSAAARAADSAAWPGRQVRRLEAVTHRGEQIGKAWEVSGTDATADGKFCPVLHLPASQQFKEKGQEFKVGAVPLIRLLFKDGPSRLGP